MWSTLFSVLKLHNKRKKEKLSPEPRAPSSTTTFSKWVCPGKNFFYKMLSCCDVTLKCKIFQNS